MQTYITRRLFLMIPTFIIVTMVVFLMMRVIPGDVIDQMVLQQSSWSIGASQLDATSNPFDRESLTHRLGLDIPLYKQYYDWMKNLFTRGSFGTTLWSGKDVAEMIFSRLPITFELGFLAFIIAQLIAFPIGIISAIRQDSWMDYLGRGFSILALAVPGFWLATLLFIWPAIWWGWSPPTYYIPITENFAGNLLEFLIPATLAGASMSGITTRMLRSAMLDVLRQDYVKTAWAKGLRERVVIIRHALRNAMIPVGTVVMGQVGVMVGGMVIMETVFSLPGMGRLFVDSIFQRDYPIVNAMNLLFAVFGLIMILITDLSYAYLDPRVRY